MSFETTISNTNILHIVEKQQMYTRLNKFTFIIFESQLRHSDPRLLRTTGCHKYAC